MHSKNHKLDEIKEDAQAAGITVDRVPEDKQIDGAGMRALADEDQVQRARRNSARNASWRSAANTSTGF